MIATRSLSAFGISTVLHAAILTAMAMIRLQLLDDQPDFVVETFFTEERTIQEINRELETETEVAETANPIASQASFISTDMGGGAGSVKPTQGIDTAESLQEPTLEIAAAPIALPGDSEIDRDLGEGEMEGGVDVVSSYGVALGRITQELLRMMRTSRVHVVWMFDESDSMKDDQEEISANFHKVYEELGIQLKQDARLRRDKEILWTTIVGFGERVHPLTPKPTSDLRQIQRAIAEIPIDESGLENMCEALKQILEKHGPQAARNGRKLVIILVSDESGDDGQKVEEVVERTKRYKAPVYVLGREAVFGYPYAHIRWKDPKYGLTHYLRINRGPETAYPECMQWNGFHPRWDVFPSGFGPYEQMRIAKESGGVFFMLPGEEENLHGHGANEKRKFDFLDMKEYVPRLEARRIYEQKRQKSESRRSIWNIIKMLNPHLDEELIIQHHHYSMKPDEFRKQGLEGARRAIRAMGLITQALETIERIRPLRDKESARRWQANYDLLHAQLLNYRVRLFQYLLALDRHAYSTPKPKDPKSNEWRIRRVPEMIEPDPAQFERVKQFFKLKMDYDQFVESMQENHRRSRELYEFVMKEHAGTPWADRAARELRWGYGMTFFDFFYDPRYWNIAKEVKFPNP